MQSEFKNGDSRAQDAQSTLEAFQYSVIRQLYSSKSNCQIQLIHAIINRRNYNFQFMKAFGFRNQKSRLILSNQKSQFNKQNGKIDNQNLNLSIRPLQKNIAFQQLSSINPHQTQVNKKVTFSQVENNQDRRYQSTQLSTSKLSKRSLTQSQSNLQKRNNTKVFSVNKLDKNPSLREIKIGTNKTIKTTKDTEERGPFRQAIEEIITILKRQYIIQQNHLKFYAIRKENLEDFLSYIFTFLSVNAQEKKEIVNKKFTNFHFLELCLTKIAQVLEEISVKQKQSHFKLHSNISKFTNTHLMFQAEMGHQKSQIIHLLKNKEQIKSKIKFHEEKDSYYKEQIEKNLAQIRRQLEEKSKLQNAIKLFNQQKERLQKDIEDHSFLLHQMKISEEKIVNFVNEQNNKMLKIVSEDYKRIESDIYEYAVYLQSNQLASDLNYEPAPFKVIQEKIMEELKVVNKTIIQDSGVQIQVKNKMMRDFVVLSMEKFRRKDNELLKLLEFKTKCIRKFVSNMQMWLDNWTLKQEYLVNLRRQFTIDANHLTDMIEQMKTASLCNQCSLKHKSLINSVADLYQKIELNYKMGNSFY